MALINGIYVFIDGDGENVTKDVERSEHPIEDGSVITDHVRRKPIELSLSGKIVKRGEVAASTTIKQIEKLKDSGTLITYVGRNALSNMQITSFQTGHPNSVWGGCTFSMTMKETEIAKPSYPISKNKGGTQQVSKNQENKVYHTVKKGDNCWNLVTKQYKTTVFYDDGEPIPNLTPMQKCEHIMALNPNAFSRKGDFRTLQIGKKIFVGFRK